MYDKLIGLYGVGVMLAALFVLIAPPVLDSIYGKPDKMDRCKLIMLIILGVLIIALLVCGLLIAIIHLGATIYEVIK